VIVNSNNVLEGMEELITLNKVQIDTLVNLYQRDRILSVFKGERPVVPNSFFPCVMFEPNNTRMSWQATRTQREDIAIRIILEVWNGDEDMAQEFLGILTTLVGRIFMWPPYLSRRIPKTAFVLVDSRIEDLQYTVRREGTVRRAEFNWTGWVIERFDANVFGTGGTIDDCDFGNIQSNPSLRSAGGLPNSPTDAHIIP